MDDDNTKNVKNEIKIIVIGDSNTGKTSFVNKWTKGIFTDFYKATVVSEFSYKIYQHNEKFYRIQLWDLAGQDQNTCITKIFSKNAQGCLVLCDITNKNSLNDTLKWKKSLDENTRFIDGDFLPSVLVQNKIDLVEEEKIKNNSEIKKFAEDNKFNGFFRTSVKMGIGIDECMEFLITNILDRMKNCSKIRRNSFEEDKNNLILEKKIVNESNEEMGKLCC